MVKLTLYVSHTSPFARIPRIVLREKRLAEEVTEIVPQTRVAASDYYGVNPSGRIPFLQGPDGLALEGSALIAEYLDRIDGRPLFLRPVGDWHALYLEEMARSFMDGLAVWVREVKRPAAEQSAELLDHERTRAARLLAFWEGLAEDPELLGPLNLTQITLATALDLDQRVGPFTWRQDHPALNRWQSALTARLSFRQTAVPDGSMIG